MLNFLQNLTNQQKITIFGGAGAFILVLILVVGLMAGGNKGTSAANQVTIFRQMDPLDAGQAAGKLKADHIDATLAEDGTAITVPKDKVDAARIDLAMAGLPKSGVKGFELFDKNSLISTDFDKRVEYNRALDGELVRLIKQLDGVDNAVVMVNMPQDSLFDAEKKPVTAAVMVKMAADRTLSQDQVVGIEHLVASSVPGLTTDNVTVTDADGNLLSSGLEANSGDQADRLAIQAIDQQNEIRRQMETDLQNRLTSLLDRLVGQGKSVVRVSLDLDFNKREVLDKLLSPLVSPNGDSIDADKNASNETIKGGTSGGVPGSTSNVPGYPALSAANSSQTVQRSTSQEIKALNQEQQRIETATGTIKRMTIAVLLPDTISQDAIDQLKDVIADAAGADPSRRDHITIERVHFDTSLIDQLKAQLDQAKQATRKGKSLAWSLVWGVAGTLLGLFLVLVLIRRMTRREENPFEALTQGLADDATLPQFDQAALAGMNMDPNAFPGFGQMGQLPQDFQQQAFAPTGGYDQPEGGPFEFLYNVSPDQVAELLSQERPATAAGILAQLDPGFAQNVMANMSPDLQEDLYNRVNANPSLPAMTQRMVSQTLRRKLGVPA